MERPRTTQLDMTTPATWVSTQEMAVFLGVSIRTLHYYRAQGKFLQEGRHFRRSTPAPNSPWAWHKELTAKAWGVEVQTVGAGND